MAGIGRHGGGALVYILISFGFFVKPGGGTQGSTTYVPEPQVVGHWSPLLTITILKGGPGEATGICGSRSHSASAVFHGIST